VKPAPGDFGVLWNNLMSSVKTPVEQTFGRFSQRFQHTLTDALLNAAWFLTPLTADLINIERDLESPAPANNPLIFSGTVFAQIFCRPPVLLRLFSTLHALCFLV